jgi:hypothetical protein
LERSVLIELLGVSELLFIWMRLTRSVNHARRSNRSGAYRRSAPTGGRWAAVILPLLALSVVLAACGGSSSSTASPTTSTSPTTAAGAGSTGTGPAGAAGSATFAKYTQCLTSHGVPASATGFGGRRRSATGTTVPGATTIPVTRPTIPAQYQAAFKTCASLLPTGGGGGGFFGGGQVNSAQAAAYRNCLQIHGVTLPTTPSTTPGQTRPTGGFGGAQFANNPTFQAAQKACVNLLPARTGSTTTTTVAAGA